jgi:predicted transcriptional regulator
MADTQTGKRLERYFKGVANHWRIEILFLIRRRNDLTLEEIAEILGGDFRTIAEHTRKLFHAGLINKKHRGRFVVHSLSPYGRAIVSFMETFAK